MSFLLCAISANSLHAQASANLEKFQKKMNQHVKNISKGTKVSVQIEVMGSGQELYSSGANVALNPASNTKLITTLAALEILGPAYTFKTTALKRGDDLVLSGNGDPFLVSEKLYLLARSVARSGHEKFRSVKIDRSAFSEVYRGLTNFDIKGEPFSALIDATSGNFNSLEVHVNAESKGKRPRIEVRPTPHGYGIVKNEVRMVSGSKRDLALRQVKVVGHKEEFVLVGTMGREALPAVVYGSVSLPDSYLAHLFAALLRKEGVTVENDFGGVSSPNEGGGELAQIESPPILDLIRLFNTYSNNFMTEQVFHAVGAVSKGYPASLKKSQDAVGAFIREQEACKNAVIDNGSGLSWATKISAKCFTEILQHSFRDFRYFADLIGSLPVGGNTGTLRNRFKRLGGDFDPQKVRAKTGTLWSRNVVTSLVGFTRTKSGEPVLFALIENDERNDTDRLAQLKDWEDKCVEYIQELEL